MKLHEKAKELGVKAKDLIKYLNDAGSDIKSPNQELTEIEVFDANNMISSPESKNFKQETDEVVIRINKDKTKGTYKVSLEMVSKGGLTLTEVDRPSRVQAFHEAEIMVARAEMESDLWDSY